jgi:hypothetical protein
MFEGHKVHMCVILFPLAKRRVGLRAALAFNR